MMMITMMIMMIIVCVNLFRPDCLVYIDYGTDSASHH